MTKANISFLSSEDAYGFLREGVFPEINKYLRLFKSAISRQDEYMVIKPMWIEDEATFTPQTYRTDRDINDMLLALGCPTSVSYPDLTPTGRHTVKRDSVLAAWRRELGTQRGRLSGLCYLPGGPDIVDNMLNTYMDVSVVGLEPPDAGTLDLILRHIGFNICNGRQEYFDYLIQWLAHMVQKPAERPGVGIAVIGDQGTGKGILIEFLKRMLGGPRNANTTASSSDTKAFNYSLGNKLFVVFDEATFAGDRQQSDFMKKFVTEPRIRIEQKGLDAYEVDNFARVFITSNNRLSAVPTGIGHRRWLTIECKSPVDADWLKALAIRIGNAGDVEGAMSGYVNFFKHYLETLDISDFNPQHVPMQDTGIDNKLQGAYKEDPIKAFLWQWLMSDKLTMFLFKRGKVGEDVEKYEDPVTWDRLIPFTDFYDLLKECTESAFGTPPGVNLVKRLLEPYGMTTVNKGGNRTFVAMEHPMDVLRILKQTSRFDDLITLAQEQVIQNWWAMDDDGKGPLVMRPLTKGEKVNARWMNGLSKKLNDDADLRRWNESETKKMIDIAFPEADDGEAATSFIDGMCEFLDDES